jgi:hypothetical protein
MEIVCIFLWPFGMFNGRLVYLPFWYVLKNLATLLSDRLTRCNLLVTDPLSMSARVSCFPRLARGSRQPRTVPRSLCCLRACKGPF